MPKSFYIFEPYGSNESSSLAEGSVVDFNDLDPIGDIDAIKRVIKEWGPDYEWSNIADKVECYFYQPEPFYVILFSMKPYLECDISHKNHGKVFSFSAMVKTHDRQEYTDKWLHELAGFANLRVTRMY